MEIIRNGEKIQLTKDEIAEAHKEFVTSWMSGVAADDFNVDSLGADDVAERAYDIYCQGDGYTEYESVEKAVEEYQHNFSNDEVSDRIITINSFDDNGNKNQETVFFKPNNPDEKYASAADKAFAIVEDYLNAHNTQDCRWFYDEADNLVVINRVKKVMSISIAKL